MAVGEEMKYPKNQSPDLAHIFIIEEGIQCLNIRINLLQILHVKLFGWKSNSSNLS